MKNYISLVISLLMIVSISFGQKKNKKWHSLNALIIDTVSHDKCTAPMYVYDRSGNKALLDNVRSLNNYSEIAGFFRLHFEDEGTDHGFFDPLFGQQRRAVAVQVYKDLSQLLRPNAELPNPYPAYTQDRYVEIEIKESDVDMPAGALAYASQWYLDVQNGITYGNVWEYINTGVDPYSFLTNPNFPATPSFHGYMRFAFDNFSYNTNLNQTASNNSFDLYTILLHEATHTLGFASLISDDGTSKQTGTSPGRYSPWDTYLHIGSSSTPLLNFDIDYDCYNSEFNTTLSSNDILGSCNNVDMSFLYPGTSVLNSVFTDPNYNNGGSVFSHFNCSQTTDYVMNAAAPMGYTQRFLNLKEVQALCAIGYEISGEYGEGGAIVDFATNSTSITYSNACPTSRIIAGANDFGPYSPDMNVVPYTVMAGEEINIIDLTQNDYPSSSEICCVEIVVGDGSITSTTNTGFTYQTAGTFIDEAIIKYRPMNSLGQKGNITYVFIDVTPPALSPCTYTSLCQENIVCHGDFEDCIGGVGDGGNYYFSDFILVGGVENSTDIYTINGNRFVGMSAYNGVPEAIAMKLSTPISIGETVNISFNSSKDRNSSSTGPIGLNLFGSLIEPCDSSVSFTNGVGTSYCPQFIPILMDTYSITNDISGQFPTYIAPNFTNYSTMGYTNTTGEEIKYIFLKPSLQTEGFILIDDISIEKANTNSISINSILTTTSVCPNENFTIDYEVCPTGGIPTSAVTLIYEDQYGNIPTGITIESSSDFDPTSGAVIIQPSDWNSSTGCVNLSLNLTVNGNALMGSSISNILNVQEGSCIIGSAVEDIIQIGNLDLLEITKTVSIVNNIATYNITVENGHYSNTYHNIIIEDIVPAELYNINSSDFVEAPANHLTINSPFSLNPNESITFSFTAEIQDNLDCNIAIENCASITSGNGLCYLPLESCVTFTNGLILNVTSTDVCLDDCNGIATVIPTNAGGSFIYEWNTPIPATTSTVNNLCSGTYMVTVTDENGCNAIGTVTINQSPEIIASINADSVICYGSKNASATVDVTGGFGPFTYAWSTTPIQTLATAVGLNDGIYTVIITDANNCTISHSVTIDNYPQIISSIHSNGLICFGSQDGAATVTVSSGSGPFTYEWGTVPTQTNPTAVGLSSGIYSVIITDVDDCTSERLISIESYDIIPITLREDTVLGLMDTLIIDAGYGFSSYLWSTGDTSQSILISTNEYEHGVLSFSVTVTDEFGCENSDTVQVTYIDNESVPEVINSNAITLFPNPTTGEINIYGVECEYVKILNIQGKLIKQFENTNKDISIDLSQEAKGVYLVKLISGKTVYSHKVILKSSF